MSRKDNELRDARILQMIGQYNAISAGGGVTPIQLASWLEVTRQGSSYHLRRLVQDGLLVRREYTYREATERTQKVVAFRYYLSEKSNEFYQDGQFKAAYLGWVYSTKLGGMFQDKINKSSKYKTIE